MSGAERIYGLVRADVLGYTSVVGTGAHTIEHFS